MELNIKSIFRWHFIWWTIFLTHPQRDVQLLVACSIANVLRVYAPNPPYKEVDQLKTIFLFMVRQLEGLEEPKDPALNQYSSLLENLTNVKTYITPHIQQVNKQFLINVVSVKELNIES